MFWDNFVDLCLQNGGSPNFVAQQLGITSGSVTGWKNGSVPRNSTLKKIADYFGVTVDYLLGNTEDSSASDEKDNEILALCAQLSEEDQKDIVEFIKFKISQKK
jgi:transcriptional regulator with XRE-family HTH domain